MLRRQFGVTTLTLIASAFARVSFAKPPKKAAAVVIGIDHVGNLPVLRAAKSGAESVADWLKGEHFDVALLTDAKHPVKTSEVFDAIAAYVNRGNIDQLVVYFAGHGFINAYAEYWLLSGAPENPNEAISVVESTYLAKQSGIPNVVIISDCCRSRSDSIQTERVRGSLAFPAPPTPPVMVCDVDVLYATLVGDPAWEVPVEKSVPAYSGVFTTTLLDAYKHPDEDMVSEVDGEKNVIANSRLKRFLVREVPKRAQAPSISIVQRPDIQVVSGDETYIAHSAKPRTGPPLGKDDPAVSLTDLAVYTVSKINRPVEYDRPGPPPPEEVVAKELDEKVGFSKSAGEIFRARGVADEFAGKSGFILSGNRVTRVLAPQGVVTDLHEDLKGHITLIADLGKQNAVPVSVRFSDGTGTVLAVLKDFFANVVTGERSVSSVAYEPSPGTELSAIYRSDGPRIAELHAAVATASRFGIFRIRGGKKNTFEARQMGDLIRVLKSVDATLGIYAAYAYASADLIQDVRSVEENLFREYRTKFFDVELLAGSLSRKGGSVDAIKSCVPYFPMLSQGWSLLRVKGVEISSDLQALGDYLLPSLWTCFSPKGMDIVEAKLFGATVPRPLPS